MLRYKQNMANERVIPSHCYYDKEIKMDTTESDQKVIGFAASSQMSFRIKVEGRREACIKSFEGWRQGGGNPSSRALQGSGGETGILKSIEGNREACIKSIEGRRGRHASLQALKGSGRHTSRALRL